MKPIRIWYQSYGNEDTAGAYLQRLRTHLQEIVDEGTTVDITGITPPDNYAHAIVEHRCARQVICNAVEAERQGYDAFVIGHFQDAGLYEARSVVNIPVLALGEASMLYACQLGQRSGIVTINPRYIPWFRHQIAKYGLQQRVAGIYAMKFEPGQFLKAFGSRAQTEEVRAMFEAQAKPLIEDGVEILIPGGGIPMLFLASDRCYEIGGAPVINGIPIVVKMAEMAVKLKRATGLSVSRVGEFCMPPPEILHEYITHPRGL